MIPDLGKYSVWVLSSYAVGLALLAALILLVWRRNRIVRARLAEMEARRPAAAAPRRTADRNQERADA
jgi:heme exporter protein CcmD